MDTIRGLVSKKKRRFKEGDFNLDLTYVTPRIIAMGFPSEGTEANYRNPMGEVLRFLDQYHRDHYKVYNLCSERAYDPAKFGGNAVRYPFDDHNPPPLDMFVPFCEDIEDWMKADPTNVIIVHCKAGKGRTGVMICAWLVYCREWETADETLMFYSAARTMNQKGVTIPSQIRYVKYFHQVVEEGGYRSLVQLYLKRLRLTHAPVGVKAMYFQVHIRGQKIFVSPVLNVKKDVVDFSWDVHVPVIGDAVITVLSKSTVGGDSKFVRFWFHTSYIENGYFVATKTELDKICKDKKHKVVPKDFAIEALFDALDSPVLPAPGSRVGIYPGDLEAGPAEEYAEEGYMSDEAQPAAPAGS